MNRNGWIVQNIWRFIRMEFYFKTLLEKNNGTSQFPANHGKRVHNSHGKPVSRVPYSLVCRISEPSADIKKRLQPYTPRPNQRNMTGQKRLQLLEEVTGSKEARGEFFKWIYHQAPWWSGWFERFLIFIRILEKWFPNLMTALIFFRWVRKKNTNQWSILMERLWLFEDGCEALTQVERKGTFGSDRMSVRIEDGEFSMYFW